MIIEKAIFEEVRIACSPEEQEATKKEYLAQGYTRIDDYFDFISNVHRLKFRKNCEKQVL